MNFKIPRLDPIQNEAEDQLNFNIAKEKIAKILDNVETPSCFGIYGIWGSGKSSLMNLTKNYIDSNPEYSDRIATVSFEAWKYEYTNVPITFNLLFTIQESLQQNLDLKSLGKKVLSIGVGALINPMLNKYLGSDVNTALENIDTINENLLSEYENWLRKKSEFKSEFEEKINTALQKNKKEKLIVFIDDLDRCKASNVLKLLEELKNYLSIKNTLFVIGVDRQIIVDVINSEYNYSRSYGDEYLNKIVSNYLNIPEINPEGIVKNILAKIPDQQILEDDEIKIISEYLSRFCKSNRRLSQIIFHKFLLSTQYIVFEQLKNELLQFNQKFSNMKVVKIAMFRWCLITSLKPKLLDNIDWYKDYQSAYNSDNTNTYIPAVREIAQKKVVDGNNEHPLVPHIMDPRIAIILNKYLNEGLFI